MLVIARFYGLIIKMYFEDHSPSHFHAYYGEYDGVFHIESLEMIYGDLPKKAQKLVREWAEMYQDELRSMWDTQEFKKLPPLE